MFPNSEGFVRSYGNINKNNMKIDFIDVSIIPPYASSSGGSWEAEIKFTKVMLPISVVYGRLKYKISTK